MKNTHRWILAVVALAIPTVSTGTVQAEDYLYETNNGTITITRYTGLGGNVTIPSTINGLPVTSIWGFYGCTSLTSITIPNSVISVGDGAFHGCTSLTAIIVDAENLNYSSVDGVLFNKSQTTLIQCPGARAGTYLIPNSVISIGDGAFYLCSSLTNVTIPNSVTDIDDRAFLHCTSLTCVTIPDGVTRIGVYAFSSCTSLTNVSIGTCVTSIGEWGFYYCTSLTSVTIPKSVRSIGSQAFFRCDSLGAITVDTLNSFYSSTDGVLFNKGQTTLVQCPGGKAGSYTIPNSVTGIGEWAFASCHSLTSVTIPNSVICIGEVAFYCCPNLTNVTIPDSVTGIGEWAFASCHSLTSITIPKSVTTIGEVAFGNCTSLSAITVDALNSFYSGVDGALFDKSQSTLIQCPGGKAGHYTVADSVTSIGEWAFDGCTNLTGVIIPTGVTSIGGAAFSDCTGLTSVTIPNSVTNIGDWAFGGCTGLSGIYFEGSAPNLEAGLYGTLSLGVDTTVFYLPGTTGWGTSFGGRPTALWVLPYPIILITTPGFGIHTNQFGLIISWATNAPVLVEASTSLANPVWDPVSTNTLMDGWSYFSDAEWTNYPARFYRIRSQ